MTLQRPVPDLPAGWLAESCQVAAEGETASGDVVRGRIRDGTVDLVLADVSGHGEVVREAAANLAGTLEDLLATATSSGLLAAVTARLHGRDWGARFATAVHLSVDLDTGEYAARGAGHPPPVRRRADTGRWRLLDCAGPVLGLLPEASYQASTGVLQSGDALLTYTDGMVEQRHRNIERGIVGMLRVAEEECRSGFDGLTERLLAGVGLREDDRAALLLQRR